VPNVGKFQYNQIYVMHFLFSLLTIMSIYMFRELFTHPQEAIHKRRLLYCLHVMSVVCTRTRVDPNPGAANRRNTHALYQVSLV
jgi:hypothetical protein